MFFANHSKRKALRDISAPQDIEDHSWSLAGNCPTAEVESRAHRPQGEAPPGCCAGNDVIWFAPFLNIMVVTGRKKPKMEAVKQSGEEKGQGLSSWPRRRCGLVWKADCCTCRGAHGTRGRERTESIVHVWGCCERADGSLSAPCLSEVPDYRTTPSTIPHPEDTVEEDAALLSRTPQCGTR